MVYLPTFSFLILILAIPLLLVLALYFLPLIAKVIFLPFRAFPFVLTSFAWKVNVFPFLTDLFLAVKVGLTVILFETLNPL